MLNTNSVFLIVAFSVVLGITAFEPNYYWRDYSGKIPEDAVIGVERPNNKNIYIGQAVLKESGLLVVEIHPGEKQVWIPHYGVKKQRLGIKILCSPEKEAFSWEGTNSTMFKKDLKDKTPVIGGLEDSTVLYIARTEYDGEPHIGKVGQFSPEAALMYIVDGENEHAVDTFEVLTYEEIVQI